MATKAVATPEPAGLPDLVQTRDDDFQIDARDIQPPRLKVASPTTAAAVNGLVPNFSLFSEKGKDDASPVVLIPPVPQGTVPAPGKALTVYVLKMYKTKAANVEDLYAEPPVQKQKGGTLRRWADDDPTAPAFARTQYNYVCYVPAGEDADLPYNLLLGNTSTPAARFINTLLGQRKQDGHSLYTQAFELWPEHREQEREGQTNHWAIFKARPAEATQEDVVAASQLYQLIAAKPTNLDTDDTAPGFSARSDAPAI